MRKRLVLSGIYSCIMLAMLAVVSGCNGSGSSSGTETISFPYDLAIASPFATAAQVALDDGRARRVRLAIASPFATATQGGALVTKAAKTIDPGATYAEKSAAIYALTHATTLSECAVGINPFGNTINADCYGPSLDYTNHPDGTPANGTLPTGDIGIWNEYENPGQPDENACAAAQVNALVTGVSHKADTALGMLASMFCVLNVTGMAVPAAGDPVVDVTSQMNSALASLGITDVTFTLATLEHQADDSDGNAVWFYTLQGTLTDATTATTSTFALFLKHIPLDALTDTGATYYGKITYAFSSADPTMAGNCNDPTLGVGVTDTVTAGSITYNKDVATSLEIMAESANFCQPDTASVTYMIDTTTYGIDRSDRMSAANPDGWANNYNYFLAEFTPASMGGSYAYAWQAGMADSHTRVFQLEFVPLAAMGSIGCAYFGYGPNATAAASTLGTIDGFICNWAGPGSVKDPASHLYVQRQCMSYNAATGYFDSVPAGEPATGLAITYAPENACNYSGGTFTYAHNVMPGTYVAYTNDVDPAIGVFNHNLVAIPTFTLPTIPTDVYPTP